MAILSYKLHIKDTKNNNAIYECNCYTTTKEAIPVSINGIAIDGDCWEIKNNGTVCYLGLMPVTDTHKSNNTPLKIKKATKEYYVQTSTNNSYSVTIKATAKQSITFIAGGVTTTVTDTDKTVYVASGTAYECYATPVTGYTKGTISGADSTGYVNANMNITVSSATINSYVVTVDVPTGARIYINDTAYTSKGTVTFNYNDQFTVSYETVDRYHYDISDLKVNGLAFTSGNTYTMPAGAITVTCSVEIHKNVLTITEGTGTTITVKDGTTPLTNGTAVNWGTVITYTANSKTGYENESVKVENT